MRVLLFIAFLMFGINIFAQANYNGEYSDVKYNYLEVSNVEGQNFVDFKLTYDNATGNDNCYNNIQVISLDWDIEISFKVYLNDVEVYSGWAKLPRETSYYLNDAFYDCYSSKKNVRVVVKPRY